MKKIYNWFINLAKDKLLHIQLEEIITAVATIVFLILGCNKESCAYGWGVGVLFGIGKELFDEKKKGTSEAADWAADLVGATVVSLYSLIIMLI